MNELVKIEGDKAILDSKAILDLIELEHQIKKYKSIEDELKKDIKTAMENKGVIKLLDEITGLSVTYIEAKDNIEKFNSEKFREDHPDLYDEYVTMDGKKSAYITIRIK